MFGTVPLSIIRSFPLYTQQYSVSYRFADSLLRVENSWWWTEELSEICRFSKFDIQMSVHRKYNSKLQPTICNVVWFTRWFKYDRHWFVCKQAAMRSSRATLREWSHNLHPPSCSGYNLFSPIWELLEWWAIMVTKKKISPGHIWTTLYLFLQMLYMFQAVPPPIIRSTKLYIRLRVWFPSHPR